MSILILFFVSAPLTTPYRQNTTGGNALLIKKGKFVTLEGGEGAGKETQKRLLVRDLDLCGISHVDVREPGGTRISEKIREMILDPKNTDLTSRAELFLFEAARAQIVDEIIKPALAAGLNVFGDRYYDSSIAYQGFGRGLNRGSITTLNRFAADGVKPDLTIYLDIDPIVALARATKNGADRIEKEGIEFHQRLREGYLWIASKEPERFKVVDASGTPEEVHELVAELAMPCFLSTGR